MDKTPRTDDIALYIKGGTVMYGKRLDDDCGEVVPADLARSLAKANADHEWKKP
jgi:hypothetical protein